MLMKKHLKAIAEIIVKQTQLNIGTIHTPKFLYADNLAGELADYFEQQNPRFDRQKFLDACGFFS